MKSKFITKTFRINLESEKILNEDAQKMGITLSSLHNMILNRYIYEERFFEKKEKIILTNATFNHIIKYLSDEELDSIGRSSGQTRPKIILATMNKQFDFENCLEFISNILGKYWGWFTLNRSNNNNEVLLVFKHQYDCRFGIFLHGYLQSMFSEIIDDEIMSEIGEDYLTVIIRKSQIKI